MSQKTFVFIGSLNREAPYFQGARGKGIAVYAFDEETGRTAFVCDIGGIDNPSFLSVHPTNGCVYAVSEVLGWNEGLVTAFRFDPEAGRLIYLNKQPTLGSITAHNSFDRSGRFMLVANYAMGDPSELPNQAVAVFPLRPDGGIAPSVASVAHAGTGPNPERQERSHPHCVQASLDNRFVVVADLGIDKLMTYAFDAGSGALTPGPVPSFSLAPGAGPRHFAFGPDGRSFFLINELDSTVCSLLYDPDRGSFALIDTAPALPAPMPDSHCADLHVHPNGRFLYGSNRGHDSIAMFRIEPDGKLTPLGTQSTLGQTPRNFAIDPTGRFLLAANQNGDSVVVFRIDQEHGTLADTGERIAIGTPMCVKFARL